MFDDVRKSTLDTDGKEKPVKLKTQKDKIVLFDDCKAKRQHGLHSH